MIMKERVNNFIRTYIKKQPYNTQLTEAEQNELLVADLNGWLRRDMGFSLSVTRFTPNRSRVICEGTYIGGKVTLRVDKNIEEQTLLQQIEDCKNDIFTVEREFKKFYAGKELTFLRFSTTSNLSYDIVFRVGAEEKIINYRTYGYPLEDSLQDFFRNERENQVIAGTFVVGDKRFIRLLNDNLGKEARIEIEAHPPVRGVS